MRQTLKSNMVAAALALGIAAPLTLGGSLVSATTAEAGFLGSIKGAAKTIGTAARNTVRNVADVRGTVSGIGAAARTAGGMVATAGRSSGGLVKDGIASAGRTVANGASKAVHEVRGGAGSIAAGAVKVGRAIGTGLR